MMAHTIGNLDDLHLGVDLTPYIGHVVEVVVYTSVQGNRFTTSHVGTLLGSKDVWKNDQLARSVIYLNGAAGLGSCRQIELEWAHDPGRMGEALESAKFLVHT